MVDLDTLGGTYSDAYAVNDLGEIIGDVITAAGADLAVLFAMLWTPVSG